MLSFTLNRTSYEINCYLLLSSSYIRLFLFTDLLGFSRQRSNRPKTPSLYNVEITTRPFLDTNSTWWEAKFACDDNWEDELVVISTDARENEFVRTLAQEDLTWYGWAEPMNSKEGTWTWDNGDAFSVQKLGRQATFRCFRASISLSSNGQKRKMGGHRPTFPPKLKVMFASGKGTAPKKKAK